jgi:hypothetical protein
LRALWYHALFVQHPPSPVLRSASTLNKNPPNMSLHEVPQEFLDVPSVRFLDDSRYLALRRKYEDHVATPKGADPQRSDSYLFRDRACNALPRYNLERVYRVPERGLCVLNPPPIPLGDPFACKLYCHVYRGMLNNSRVRVKKLHVSFGTWLSVERVLFTTLPLFFH